jgi:hypothetical protein
VEEMLEALQKRASRRRSSDAETAAQTTGGTSGVTLPLPVADGGAPGDSERIPPVLR